MATIPVRVSVTVVDEWGTEASTDQYAQCSDTNTVAAMETEVTAWINAIDAITSGYIKNVRLTLFPSLPTGVKSAAASGSRVEQTGLLGFNANGTAKRYTFDIPSISDGATVLNGDRVVLTALDPVAVLIAILTTVGTVLTWCNEHNQQINKFIDTMVGFHKKRKQLQRSSFQT